MDMCVICRLIEQGTIVCTGHFDYDHPCQAVSAPEHVSCTINASAPEEDEVLMTRKRA